MPNRPDNFHGMDLTSPINRIPAGRVALAQNVRAYNRGSFELRSAQSAPTLTIDAAVQTIQRMNDTTPAGPSGGYVLISKSASGNLYNNSAIVANGMSANPVSIIPFRPNTSPQPWAYVGDSSQNVTLTGSGFSCAGMVKIRSDGTTYKTGIAEPQIAPSVTFNGGSGGAELIYYRYVYRSSATGATSNPSPETIGGTNALQTFAGSDNIPTDITFNAAQWETVGAAPHQLRTTAAATNNPSLLDYVVAKNFNLSVPAGLTITGIQVTMNWAAQSSTGSSLQNIALYYQGNQLGSVKSPGIQALVGSSNATMGGVADNWGTQLTPAIVNDSTFGFGVQIACQTVRLFINSFFVTVFCNAQNTTIAGTPSIDPQVDKIDYYRFGSFLPVWTYVGTAPNSAPTFNDILNDLSISGNQQLSFANFEPFPSIDLPRKGIVNVAAGLATLVSGDIFNLRWLPGTIILIAGVPYTLNRRPLSITQLTSNSTTTDPNNFITTTVPPDGFNLTYEIPQPYLATQPLPYLFGPTDNINFTFGVGDPLRPGVLYWCSANNLDAAPQTNQMDVTDPSEALVNGAMSGGRGVLFSISRAWIILPNFFNALATVNGTSGSTWTLQATSINRGLFMPWCLAVEGGGKIFFRVADGIDYSQGGAGSQSITDSDLYPLFSHEGSTPSTIVRNGVTIYPPNDSLPQQQKFSIDNGYLYYDYTDVFSQPRTLVFDIAAMGWIWDVYSDPATAHGANEGQSIQGTLVGCVSGAVRFLASAGTEIPQAIVVTPAIGGTGWQMMYQVCVEYQSTLPIILSMIPADFGSGSYGTSTITIPSSVGMPAKFIVKVSANKWRLMQFRFVSNDPNFQIYLAGFVVDVKDWGSQGPFKPVRPFMPHGGDGAQP